MMPKPSAQRCRDCRCCGKPDENYGNRFRQDAMQIDLSSRAHFWVCFTNPCAADPLMTRNRGVRQAAACDRRRPSRAAAIRSHGSWPTSWGASTHAHQAGFPRAGHPVPHAGLVSGRHRHPGQLHRRRRRGAWQWRGRDLRRQGAAPDPRHPQGEGPGPGGSPSSASPSPPTGRWRGCG